MIIDFHVHCFPDALAEKAIPALAACAGTAPYLNGKVGELLHSMDLAGIDCSVIQNIATRPSQTAKVNQWARETQGDRVLAFGSIHPKCEDWMDEMEAMVRGGLKGMKFHPDYQEFYADDPSLFPLYEKAREYGLILLFHAGVDIGLPGPVHAGPERLRHVADAFPGARIVAAHMGGYAMWDETEACLAGSSVYLDTSYCLGHIHPSQFERIIRKHGADKILFGTDSPWTDQAEEIRRLKELSLAGAEWNAIMGENARKLLGIS